MSTTEPQVFTHGGQSVTLPVRVGHARQAAATFLVDADAAQRVIDETGLRVTRRGGNRALVSLALVEYLENDLGTYDELALAFVVDDVPGTPPGPKGSVSTYIHRLPVDGEFTCAAGRGIWGFPKWVADLDVTFDDRGATAVLREGELEVVRITMRRGPVPLPRRPLHMNAYSYLDGVRRRTPWVTDGVGRQHIRPGGTTVEVGYGHPLADELRSMGFPRRSVVTIFDDHMRATFEAPIVV